MPELKNARWERFARAIVLGMDSQKDAYMQAGYSAHKGNSSEAAASRLLRTVKPVIDRVRELHEEQKTKLAERNRFTIETIARRMALASTIAEEDRNANAITTSEIAIARLLGIQVDRTEVGQPGDFSQVNTSQDMAKKLLADTGCTDPDDTQINMMIEEMRRHSACTSAIAAHKTPQA